MRSVMLETPPHFLEERRRLGHDKRDELWEGVLHMPPPASYRHQHLSKQLLLALDPGAKAAGLEGMFETGLYRAPKNYRVPDLLFVRPEHVVEAGVSGAEVVIEILSPDDETYEKLDFYAEAGVKEV